MTTNQPVELADTVSRFETAWKSGQPVSIADCVPPESGNDTDLLVELACIDLQYRLQNGQTSRVEAYVAEFPSLADDELILLELVRTEWSYRSDRDELKPEEFTTRFPNLVSHLKVMFQMEVDRSGITHANQQEMEWICRACQTEIGSRSTGSTICPQCGEPVAIGRYQLLARVGEGAFGYVYRARDPKLDREVALKLPRTRQFLVPEESERFLRESRNAAQLDHPGIVRIYDAGKHNETPYIVSEFVEGRTLHERLKDHEFSFKEAAVFVQQMSEAIAHAHERGVIHRDLKPANVMTIGNAVDELVPRIMDFGLARRSLVDAAMTMDGHAVGTPAYMSPEQARGDVAEVDEQSDVYSLGVILFQLLCGELPFRGNAQMLIQQVINDDPPSPSRFNSRIPRDLETICLKCMDREPRKRYASAKQLAEELMRWREGRPIVARPLSTAGRIWRWCKRYPGIAGLSAALLLTLSGGLAGVTSQWMRAEKNAKLYKAEADQNLLLAESEALARKKAEFEAGNKEVVINFMNQVLAAGQPDQMGRDARVMDAVKAAVEKVDETFIEQPRVEAMLRFTIGNIYRGYGSIRAIEQFRKSLALFLETDGEESHDTLEAMDDLAGALRSLAESEQDVRESAELRERVLRVRRRMHGDDHEEARIATNNLAVVYAQLGEHQRALDLYKWILATTPEDSPEDDDLMVRQNIAMAHCGMGQFEIAEPILRTLVKDYEYLPDFTTDARYYNSVDCLAQCLLKLQKYAESEKYFRQSINGRTQVLGASHRHTLRSYRYLAELLLEAGEFEEALAAIEESLAIHMEDPGPARGYTVLVYEQKFDALVSLNQLEEAENYLRERWEFISSERGADHEYSNDLADRLLNYYESQGMTDKAAGINAIRGE